MDEAPTSHQPEEEEEEEGQDSTEQEEEEEEEPQRVKIVSLLSAYASKFFSPIMGDVTGLCVREREADCGIFIAARLNRHSRLIRVYR